MNNIYYQKILRLVAPLCCMALLSCSATSVAEKSAVPTKSASATMNDQSEVTTEEVKQQAAQDFQCDEGDVTVISHHALNEHVTIFQVDACGKRVEYRWGATRHGDSRKRLHRNDLE